MNPTFKRFTVLGIALVLVLGGLFVLRFWQLHRMQAQLNQPQPPAVVETVEVNMQRWPDTLDAIGSLRAVNGVSVANEIAGVVDTIEFESGDRVARDEVLVQLDAEVDRAALATRRAEEELARVQFERFSELVGEEAVSASEYDEARSNYEAAQARVVEQQARLDKMTIRAPYDGVTGLRQVDVGEYLEEGSAIVEINMLDPILVNYQLPEKYLPSVAKGDRVDVRVAAHGQQTFTGEVQAIEASVNEATRMFGVRARVDNPDHQLRPGMFANVSTWRNGQLEVVAVPRTAISFNTYGDFAYVVVDGEDGHRVERRQLDTGLVRDGAVEVRSGLKPGEEIVSAGLLRLRDGQRVTVDQNADSVAERKRNG